MLLVPGLNDSGPRHWQTLWERAHPTFHRVVQPDFAIPDLERWASVVSTYVRAAPVPPLVVAHSFGCLAVIRAACKTRLPLAGVMLVAPADPEQFGAVSQLPAARLPYPTVLVASTNDPWLRLTHAGRLAQQWGARLVACGNAGHINADSGLGAWPAGIALLRDLAERAAAAGTIVPPGRRARPASLAAGLFPDRIHP